MQKVIPEKLNLFLLSSLAMGVFLIVLFMRDIPARMANGDYGRVAIATLDEVRRPFLEIYAAESLLMNEGYSKSIQHSLDRGIKRGQALIKEFKQTTQYNPEVLRVVERLGTSFESWVKDERALFTHKAKTRLGLQAKEHDTTEHHLLAATSAGFSRTMAYLGDGEVPIHDDIHHGSQAVTELTALSSVLVIMLLGGIYYLQWSRNKMLRGLLDEVEQQVRVRTDELNSAQEELVRKERLATLGQLTATVSHELRNPLGAIRPSLYLMKKYLGKDADEKLLQAYDRIDRNILRCDHIIDELLDFTRIARLNRQPVRLDSWLEQIIDEQDFPEGLELEKDLSLNDLELSIDDERLRRAIINIVDNACHAMQDMKQPDKARRGSSLEIKTTGNENRVEITVTDTGTGIPENILEKIYEPLFSTKGFGVGLGMSTVKQIMEQHGGGMEIASTESSGTTVTLWLPINGVGQNS